MKSRVLAVVCLASLSLAACSPRAASVAPVSMGDAYASVPCERVTATLAVERANVTTLSSAQNSAATADAIGVFLFAVPVSNITGGNKAGDLGAAKGKVLALESRAMACNLS